jgi:homoaconitase/3-isopropylmalate dehydratase large subunit
MGYTLTEKILREHLVDGSYQPGEEIGIKIDQTLTQDATGTMAYLQFEHVSGLHHPRDTIPRGSQHVAGDKDSSSFTKWLGFFWLTAYHQN